MLRKWLIAMWDGMRLVCPNCRKGPMYRTLTEMHPQCPSCGVSFEPNEGDFVGAMTVAYSITGVLIAIGVFILEAITDLPAMVHLAIWSIFSIAFLIGCYRNLKGIWVGILYAMTDLRRNY